MLSLFLSNCSSKIDLNKFKAVCTTCHSVTCKCEEKKVNRNKAILLGGYGREDSSYMSKIATMLRTEGLEVIDNISVDTNQSIWSQAYDVKKILLGRGVTKEDNLVVIGHSQGGLRGYELHRSFKSDLNVVALFTISTPWSGVTVLDKLEEIEDILDRMYRTWHSCSSYSKQKLANEAYESVYNLSNKIEELYKQKRYLSSIKNSYGITDMKKGSDYIKGLNEFNDTIPIFNIISYYNEGMFSVTGMTKEEAFRRICNGQEKIDGFISIGAGIGTIVGFAGALTSIFFPPIGAILAVGSVVTAAASIGISGACLSNLKSIIEDLHTLADMASEFDEKKSHDLLLTSIDQKLPFDLDRQQRNLRDCYRFENPLRYSLKYSVNGIHDCYDFGDMYILKSDSRLVYNKERVLDYIKISLSIENKEVKPVLSSKDIKDLCNIM